MVKLLSNAEYEKLILSSKKDSTDEAVKKLREEHLSEIRAYNSELEQNKRTMAILKEDNAIALKRKEDEVTIKIQQATKVMEDQISKLTMEKNNFQKECEILTKAFENLGFDVKDMKGILDKLVDGLIAKNKIQLVK